MKKILFISLIILSGCTFTDKKSVTSNLGEQTSLHHARGFNITKYRDYTKIVVHNPWDSTQLLATYILVDRNRDLPANLPQGKVVKVPVQSAAIATSVHVGIWKSLGQIDKIVAITEPEYIDFPEIKVGLKSGKIIDLGLSSAINLERLMMVNPDVLIVSPFEKNGYGKLEKSKTVIVQDASYMEESPLARAEWVKFEAAFCGQDSLANAIFSKIEKRYNDLAQRVKTVKYRPTVLTERKSGQAWYVPGGNSYIGKFLNDAGADYFWKDLKKSGSVPISFETVYEKAEKADFWLIKYNNVQQELTYSQLLMENNLYGNFEPFKQRKIYACNTGTKPFYEEGPMEPDVILADMISVFHPDLLPNYQPKYYSRLK